jgi:hypothetical protein
MDGLLIIILPKVRISQHSSEITLVTKLVDSLPEAFSDPFVPLDSEFPQKTLRGGTGNGRVYAIGRPVKRVVR